MIVRILRIIHMNTVKNSLNPQTSNFLDYKCMKHSSSLLLEQRVQLKLLHGFLGFFGVFFFYCGKYI